MSDTSQKGNGSNFRNETLNGKPLVPISGGRAWIKALKKATASGVFRFDYVSTTRPVKVILGGMAPP